MNNSFKYLRECRIRHYQNMDKTRALLLLGSLNSKKPKEFKKRINACKKEVFIK